MKILTLTNYDLVFTTSFAYKHGVSGHLYELIDYYYICSIAGLNCAIILSDGVTKDVFKVALTEKYNFSDSELDNILSNTIESFQPSIIRANNMCIVDGSWQVRNCTIYVDNMYLLRCSETNFTFFHNNKTIKCTHLMQDFKLYPERFEDLDIEVVDYVKKILWTKYHTPKEVKTNTGLLYLTTNCRAITLDSVRNIIGKGICDKYLLITNDVKQYASLASDTVTVEEAPVKDIFERFDTYIYTPTEKKADCSPRFIVECAVFGKDVVYEIDYECKGIERRIEDMQSDISQLKLTTNDFFVKYVKEHMYEKVC